MFRNFFLQIMKFLRIGNNFSLKIFCFFHIFSEKCQFFRNTEGNILSKRPFFFILNAQLIEFNILTATFFVN